MSAVSYQFRRLAALGGELRQIHLLESRRVEEFITGYPVGGDNRVEKPVYRNPVATAPGSDSEVATAPGSDPEVATAPGSDLDPIGKVYINDTQYFSGVPEVAWNFYIGGYQPAQKWLKDRKGRTLSYDDIRHYQKIIVALTETDRIMKEIDKIDFIDPA